MLLDSPDRVAHGRGFYFLYLLKRLEHFCLCGCCSLCAIARECVRIDRIGQTERECDQRQKARQEFDERTGRRGLLHIPLIIQRKPRPGAAYLLCYRTGNTVVRNDRIAHQDHEREDTEH